MRCRSHPLAAPLMRPLIKNHSGEYKAAGVAVVDELDVSDHLMDLIHWEFEARNAIWWMSIRYRS